VQIIHTQIADVIVLEPKVYADKRGFFFESYNENSFAQIGITEHFIQDNHSHSKKNVLRGLHYQTERAQGKLVRVLQGEIFDVAVDLRPKSPTFGKWTGAILSSENHRMIWIPKGFAHGYCVTSETADVSYKVTDIYSPKHERTLLWKDPDVAIQWPLTDAPILSVKDRQGHFLQDLRA
jgi:dTDP-4-dehydrorhamnose 3,5-epimerase